MRRTDREVRDISEMEGILRQCKTCHVAMVDAGRSYVVPLSFGYRLEGGALTLYFHSAHEGRKLDILRQGPEVCFEISREGEPATPETPCNSGYYYASVIGTGSAVFLDDVNEKCAALSAIVRHQSGSEAAFTRAQADTVCVFQIVSTEFTGKRKAKPI